MLNKILLTAGFIFIAACAHHPDVRPGADGIHRVVIQTDDEDEGSREAISQANSFCEQRKLTPAFINEERKYTGSMKEEEYKSAKTATKVGTAVGSAAYVFGGKRESSVGGLVGLGSAIGNQALGKGYSVEMKFKCQ